MSRGNNKYNFSIGKGLIFMEFSAKIKEKRCIIMNTKNVVIISSSPRLNGNSDTLAKEFMRGASENGYEIKYYNLGQMNLGYCRGCYACANTGECFQNDGMNEISKSLIDADVILFATPVYFYTMSAQLKVLIDRLVPVYTEIHADIYMIITAADNDRDILNLTIESIRGATRDCLADCAEMGVLIADSLEEKGAVKNRADYLKTAYELGKNC